jgi:uncharacterized OB-fold protein
MDMNIKNDGRLPVVAGLFTECNDGPYLSGTRCASCSALYFPEVFSCRNPACLQKKVEPTLLPSHGKLISYTVQRYRPPPLFRVDGWEPYAIGLIDLGEGLEVMGMLSGFALEEIKIGTDVHLVIETLYTDDNGKDVVTYKFAPGLEGAAA